jgi:hypothetical protein
VLDTVLPRAAARVDPALPRVLFGWSNGASWVVQPALDRPEPFSAELASRSAPRR